MHKSGAAVVMTIVAALFVLITSGTATTLPLQGDLGLALPSPASWQLGKWGSLWLNLALNVLIVWMMILINKVFNVLRSMSRLHVGLFVVMQAAVPRELLSFNSGTLLALSMLCCLYLLMSCYDAPEKTRRVFLAFMIIALGSAVQYCFLIFIPVFWIVAAQMKIMNLRTFLASILGIITVWVNLLGFGVVSFNDFHMPYPTSIFAEMDLTPVLYLLIAVSFTVLILVSSTVLNLYKTIAYNARARAYNGALTLVALTVIVAMALNFNNMLAYLPLLNLCAAYQLTHYLVNHRFDKQYVVVLSVCAVYVLLYLWRLVL